MARKHSEIGVFLGQLCVGDIRFPALGMEKIGEIFELAAVESGGKKLQQANASEL